MPNALIFSPYLDGHRQVYVFVITTILQELGFDIYIAGNLQEKITNSIYIDKLKTKSEITIIDTANYASGGLEISLNEFLEIQNKCKSDLTIFTEADHHFPLFISQIFGKKNKFRGKVVGIFMRPFYFYRDSTLLSTLKFLKHFPSRWKKDEQFFYDFFMARFHLLDVALCIDENFVSRHHTFKWLPDVFQQYAELILKTEENSEQKSWIGDLNAFTQKNKSRFIFLYFGTAQYRRGYDLVLKLAEETGGCFVHCGLRDDDKFDKDILTIRTNLSDTGRLFETNEYIDDPCTIEHFFKSASHLILPYRKYFGSSGVMLQALSLGIPVLSPENGIIGKRIKNYRLGKTYTEKDWLSFKNQFESFKKIKPQIFEKDIHAYMDLQTTDQLKNVLTNSFTGSNLLVKQPAIL